MTEAGTTHGTNLHKSRETKDVNFANSTGTSPENPFPLRSKPCNPVKYPISVGMVALVVRLIEVGRMSSSLELLLCHRHFFHSNHFKFLSKVTVELSKGPCCAERRKSIKAKVVFADVAVVVVVVVVDDVVVFPFFPEESQDEKDRSAHRPVIAVCCTYNASTWCNSD